MSFNRELYIKEAKEQCRSPEFINETLKYADYLISQDLPVIFSTKHLAMLLNLEFYELKQIISDRKHYYKYYHIKKKKGGKRQISSPFQNLKNIQNWIYHCILKNIPISDYATAYRHNKSIKENAWIFRAKVHHYSAPICTTDSGAKYTSL